MKALTLSPHHSAYPDHLSCVFHRILGFSLLELSSHYVGLFSSPSDWDLKEELYVLIVYTAIRMASHRAMIEKCLLNEWKNLSFPDS